MSNELIKSGNFLSDNILDNIIGGISDATYASIKKELDAAANNNDFNTFSAIVVSNTSSYGKEFYARVVYDYTKSGFLTTSRRAHLNADLVANT